MRASLVSMLHRDGEVGLSDDEAALLVAMSAATIDRRLAPAKERDGFKATSHTKPGSLLKSQIPIRTWSEWNEQLPGFVEIDLVGHEGGNSHGEFCFTLTMVDVATGWTVNRSVANMAAVHVADAIEFASTLFPFPILGIDSDNGSEFINAHLLDYCETNKITFTRGRPGNKNDGCHVEQKNWTHVRSLVGYLRYDTPAELDLLNEIWELDWQFTNLICAQQKLISRERVGPITVDINWGTIRRTVAGNICQVLAEATEILTEANAPFRLKGPKSVNVRPHPPLALKELLVNCLAHANHDAGSPISVTGGVETVTFVNQGSLMEGVDALGLGHTSNRAYRNPVVANFLYGFGAMDKFGSGLVHVREWAQEDGGDASFEPDGCSFLATVRARPERPDEGATIARPANGYEVFYANALPVRFRRGFVDMSATTATSRAEVFERNTGVQTAPFNPHGGNLLTLSDLETTTNPLASEVRGSVKHVAIRDFCQDPDDERLLVQLLNESLRRHAKDRGLLVYGREQRLYFPKSVDGERRISYHGRLKDSTRTVVEVRRSRTTNQVTYYEHHAVRWQFRRFGDDWHLLLVPGWIFTRDGEEDLLHPKRVTSLSTRRAARDYNPNVSAHLYFWASMLVGDDAREIVLADGSDAVVLERQPVTAHLAGVPSPAGGEDDEGDDADLELDELEGELERLVLADNEDDE